MAFGLTNVSGGLTSNLEKTVSSLVDTVSKGVVQVGNSIDEATKLENSAGKDALNQATSMSDDALNKLYQATSKTLSGPHEPLQKFETDCG